MITVQFKLTPTIEQAQKLSSSSVEYIRCVNNIVRSIVSAEEPIKPTSATVQAILPSAVKNEAIRAAKSVVAKFKKGKCDSLPILKKPVITWNNQNFKIEKDKISFPLLIDGKSKRIQVSCVLTDYQRERLNAKHGTLRITLKNGKWIAQVAVEPQTNEPPQSGVMGVDLGLKNPAVAVTDTGTTRFFGNGRMNKYMKRQFRSRRKKLSVSKNQKAIDKLGNKEQRWMKDQDHKISREIVNFAKDNGVSEIRLEQLQNIRNTARTSRKNEKNLHAWSFYRLAMFILYKAALVGISVEFVNPAYTSQKCPVCEKMNHAKDRKYKCLCGFVSHRDRVGAINIISAPVVSDKRKLA